VIHPGALTSDLTNRTTAKGHPVIAIVGSQTWDLSNGSASD